MKIFKLIRQKVYNFFHPSFQDSLRRFGIMEDLRMPEEEQDRCIKMVEEKRKEITSNNTSNKNEDQKKT